MAELASVGTHRHMTADEGCVEAINSILKGVHQAGREGKDRTDFYLETTQIIATVDQFLNGPKP